MLSQHSEYLSLTGKALFPALLMTALLLPAHSLKAEPVIDGLRTGEWEMTTRMEIPQASYAMPSLSYRKCISHVMMDPSQINPGNECAMLKRVVVGNTYHWHLRCTTENGIREIKGEARYNGNSMQAEIHVSSNKLNIIRHIQGHQTGPCPTRESASVE